MRKDQKLWTREELILAINLYCKIPFGRLHKNNPEVIKLSELILRTPSSVAFKLVNFASLDPSLKARGIKGAYNSSKLDKLIWEEFYQNWEELIYESENLRDEFELKSIEKIDQIYEYDELREGKEKNRIVKVRLNQNFFRNMILSSYNNTCCVTGIKNIDFLIAGHIRPWALDDKNRLNPRNGLAINALHDKAFEKGLITITTDYKIKISSLIMKDKNNQANSDFFIKYDGKEIILPSRFLPDIEFLKYHNQERFKP